MCETQNDQNAGSCKYCGYIFENFGSDGSITSRPSQPEPSSDTNLTSPEVSSVPNLGDAPATPTGFPLFVVSRSLFTSFLPTVMYLIFIALFGLYSGPYLVVFVVFFILIAVLPVLLSPRKYEFYDGFLKIRKILGKASEMQYSDLRLYRSTKTGRRQQIILAVEGQRRGIVIPGNPTNAELGKNLNQFLEGKLEKLEPKPAAVQQPEQSDPNANSNTNSQ